MRRDSMKKTFILIGTIILQWLSFTHTFSQSYTFPITDLPLHTQHNLNDTICALHILPQRGSIYDRRGRTLVSDSILYDLMVRPGKVKKQDAAIICRLLKITPKEYQDRLKYALNWQDPWQPDGQKTRDRPAPFKGMLSKELTRHLLKQLPALQPAFSLQKRAVRHYPFNTAAHLLGYVKAPGTGETGMEESFDNILRGVTGLQFRICDHVHEPTRPWMAGQTDVLAEKGNDIYTTLDIPLQLLGEKLMKGKRGSIVAIDPETGGILAMVSSPGYSPAELALHRNTLYPALAQHKDKPFMNRAIASYNAPGSVFKVVQALIGLQSGVIDPQDKFTCKGGYTLCGLPARPKCHVTGVHKPNLVQALTISCNGYFADMFRKTVGLIPKSGLADWAASVRRFGFGARTGIELPGEKAGIVPDTALYNRKYPRGWNGCTILSNAIGQGEVGTTVLQLANAMSIIAGKGWFYAPHLTDSISGIKNSNYQATHLKTQAFDLADSLWNLVHQGMYDAVHSKTGTAYSARVPGLDICGKTGTVENGNGQKDHSVFAAFAPRYRPRIAIVCMIENGGFGAEVAAPVVSRMIREYLAGSR